MKTREKSYQVQKPNLESYSDDIRRAAFSLSRIETASRENSIKNLSQSILQSSHEMNTYILEQTRDAAKSTIKQPRLARLLRSLSLI